MRTFWAQTIMTPAMRRFNRCNLSISGQPCLMFNMVKDHRATELIILLATKDRLHSFHDARWELQHGGDQQAGERCSQIEKGKWDGKGWGERGRGMNPLQNQPYCLSVFLFLLSNTFVHKIYWFTSKNIKIVQDVMDIGELGGGRIS